MKFYPNLCDVVTECWNNRLVNESHMKSSNNNEMVRKRRVRANAELMNDDDDGDIVVV